MTRRLIACILLSFASMAAAGTCMKTRDISFDDLMGNDLSASIPLTVPMPIEYEHASLKGAPSTYSYWMVPGEIDSVQRTGDMPVKTGYIYGKVSTDVGYDQAKDAFIGTENMKQQLEDHGMSLISSEQININGYAVLLMEIMAKAKKIKVYSMYAGMNVATNAVYLTYHPPGCDNDLGDCYWEKLKSTLLTPRKTGASPTIQTSFARKNDDLSRGLDFMKSSKNQDEFVVGFAAAAHDGRIDTLLGMMAPSVRKAAGDESIKANLRDAVVPFFAKFSKVHSYASVTHAALPDGRMGTWHDTYIVDDTDKPKPFRIAIIEEQGDPRVVFIEVGKCIEGRHPFCN